MHDIDDYEYERRRNANLTGAAAGLGLGYALRNHKQASTLLSMGLMTHMAIKGQLGLGSALLTCLKLVFIILTAPISIPYLIIRAMFRSVQGATSEATSSPFWPWFVGIAIVWTVVGWTIKLVIMYWYVILGLAAVGGLAYYLYRKNNPAVPADSPTEPEYYI